jgi:opacity protein-like surface antigen
MSNKNRFAVAALAALIAAAPLAAQVDRPDRFVVIGLYSGGYDHLWNLNDAGNGRGTADFTPGHSYGSTVGVQLNRYVGLHGDFTFAQNRAEGDESFAGRRFNRFFYGAHVELGYPLAGGVTPYLFLGGGAVTVDELGQDATISPFTKPAAMFGLGFFYPIAGRFEVFAEGKDLVYRWDRGGFAPIPWYFTTTGGQMYQLNVSTGNFDRTQWDLTYTFGLSYRFKSVRHPVAVKSPSDE